MDQPLSDTRFTGNQIQQWLSEYYKHPISIKSCQAIKIAAGQGFTSTILRIFLEYNGESDSLPKSVVLKTPSMAAIGDLMDKLTAGQEHNMEETIEFVTMGHHNECEAYRTLAKERPTPLPVIYAATHCHDGQMGVILMEDLADRSTTIGDPTVTLSLEQLYAAAEAVADWHAWCITTNMDWKQHFESGVSEQRKKQFSDWFIMMENCFQRVKVNYPNVFDQLDVNTAKSYIDIEQFSKLLDKHYIVIPEVIVHGDFYGPNLMYEKLTDGAVGSKLVAIIDWPLSHRGCGMEDFARLLTTSVDTDTRRRYTQDVLRRYYDTLVKKAGDKVKASFEEVLKVYYDHFILAGLFYTMMLDWLQNLFVLATGEEREKKRQILFERCLAVYEDMMPLISKRGS